MLFEKQEPVRMCVVCRTRFFQKGLVRLKILDGKLVFFDGYGRSVYLCIDCLKDEKLHHKILKVKQITRDKEQIDINIWEIREQCQIK